MGNSSHQPNRLNGFTLIELLIVIAIISVFASILLAVFAQAREQARQSTCLSNEKQLGLAMMQYVQDFDERFPSGINANWGGPTWSGEGWAGQCYPYVNSTAVFACPDDTTTGGPNNLPVSYAYNINLVSGQGLLPTDPQPGISLSSLNSSSRTVLLFEVSGVTANITDSLEGSELGGTPGEYLSASGIGLDNRLYAHFDDTTSTDTDYATGYLGG